jgi:hypothetical protein
VSDRRAPPVSVDPSALTLPPSLSLAALWGRPVGAVSLARARSLSLCPTVPTCQLVLNLPPTISSPWTRPRPRVLRPRPRPAPLLSPRPARPPPLSHLRPLPNPLPLSLVLPTRAGSSATAHRRPLPILRPPSRLCPVQCHGELRLIVSATRDTLQCALSLFAASGPCSPEQSSRSRSPAAIALSSLCASVVASRHQRFPSR